MKSIQFKDLDWVNERYILVIHTFSNKVIICRLRNTSATSLDEVTSPNGVIGTLGYILLNETENDVYKMGLELDRSISFNQIKEMYVRL